MGETGPLRVRMGVHTGAASLRDGDYYGPTLNRAARLMSVGHGGQILVSLVTSELIRGSGVDFVDLGSHELRGLAEPEHVFQVVHPGLESEFGPLRSLPSRARRSPPSNLPAPVDRFVGRVQSSARSRTASDRRGCSRCSAPAAPARRAWRCRPRATGATDFDDRVYFVDLSACRDVDVRAVGHRAHDRGPRAERPAAPRWRSRSRSGRSGCCSCSTTSSR